MEVLTLAQVYLTWTLLLCCNLSTWVVLDFYVYMTIMKGGGRSAVNVV